tara:strand:- start:5236 stop:5715 length:480 start_codon:yes stop_codon:yes gene_type:complete
MIAETIALVSAANAAFATVKKFTQNGRELADMAGSLSTILDAEETLTAQGNSKEKSLWYKAFGNHSEGIAEFLELEKLKEQKKELVSIMRLYGRPGMYDDYVKFQGTMRVRKKRAAEQREEARQTLIYGCIYTAIAFLTVFGCYGLVVWALDNKGIFAI